jgi:F-type H+-transporting ATPase subunit epsilon
MPLQLAIVTPRAEALAIDCAEVVIPGTTGELDLMPGHLPLVTTIRPGVLTVGKDGRRDHYAVGSGYAEIDDDRVTVLTEACLAADQVDVDEARSDLESAEQAMAGTGPVDDDFDENARSIAWARARLEVRERR